MPTLEGPTLVPALGLTASATRLFALVAVAWMAIGLVISFIMARRGHSLFSWWLLGALFGPLAVVLAFEAEARARRHVVPTVLEPGSPGGGTVDVLVGIDGSESSRAALRRVAELLGPRIRRLGLAVVVGYDAALDPDEWEEERAGARELARAKEVCSCEPELVMLAGPPHKALARFGVEHGFHLLAIGARGRGTSKALIGSTASQLARGAGLPVLIVHE